MPQDFEYRRLRFQGFNEPGECFLRVRILKNKNLVFLCKQLIGYSGTSVTNAAEAILEAAVRKLEVEKKLPSALLGTFFRRGGRHLLTKVVRHSQWVEHYPPGTGLAPNGSYAIVSFGEDLKPVWNYVSRASAARACEVDEAFLSVNANLLVNGN